MMQADEHSRLLSIYDICQQGSRALGPGLRYVVWTQGCPFRCEGCATPASRPISNAKQIRISELAQDIMSRKDIEGITISGGEPFLQAGVLADLTRLVLEVRPELTILLFTGYLLESLNWPEARRLLTYVDLLIDGPYVQHLNDRKGLRGSSNQRLHFLTSRLLPWKEELENGKRKVEVHVGSDRIKAFGIPSPDLLTIN